MAAAPHAPNLVPLVSVALLAVVGGTLTGIPMARIALMLEDTSGPLGHALRREFHRSILSISIATRVSLTLGIAFLMVWKPELLASAVVVVAAAVLGLGVGVFFCGPLR